MTSRTSTILLISSTFTAVLSVALYLYSPEVVSKVSYETAAAGDIATTTEPIIAEKIPVLHIKTPEAVRGVYMTACIAGHKGLRSKLVANISGTEINSIMIDIKDYTGTLAYSSTSVAGPKGRGCKIYDLDEFIVDLHERGFYIIARITVFQDPLYSMTHPALAVQSIVNAGKPWKDKKGLSYIDPNHPEYWEYILDIAKEAYEIGFDEINFDYIRFPSDGIMEDALFATPPGVTRISAMSNFFSYLQEELSPLGIPTSADIFGQTTVTKDDMGIGQVLEHVLPYFDFVAPMAYPSHFIDGFMGFDNPAEYPYEVLKGTMMSAVERAVAASSTPNKLRPWLQAFDLGADYTPEMIRKQIQGVYDAGLTSWLLWDAANKYNRDALLDAE